VESFYVRYGYSLLSVHSDANVPILFQAIDTWTFNIPSLRGLGLTKADWRMLGYLAKILKVCFIIEQGSVDLCLTFT